MGTLSAGRPRTFQLLIRDRDEPLGILQVVLPIGIAIDDVSLVWQWYGPARLSLAAQLFQGATYHALPILDAEVPDVIDDWERPRPSPSPIDEPLELPHDEPPRLIGHVRQPNQLARVCVECGGGIRGWHTDIGRDRTCRSHEWKWVRK